MTQLNLPREGDYYKLFTDAKTPNVLTSPLSSLFNDGRKPLSLEEYGARKHHILRQARTLVHEWCYEGFITNDLILFDKTGNEVKIVPDGLDELLFQEIKKRGLGLTQGRLTFPDDLYQSLHGVRFPTSDLTSASGKFDTSHPNPVLFAFFKNQNGLSQYQQNEIYYNQGLAAATGTPYDGKLSADFTSQPPTPSKQHSVVLLSIRKTNSFALHSFGDFSTKTECNFVGRIYP